MKKILALLALSVLGLVVTAGTNTASVSPSKVRSETLLSMSRWASHPADATACGGADCCVDSLATDADCIALARDVRRNPLPWAAGVEEWYTRSTSTNWICNQWVPTGSAGALAYCEAWPATQSVRDADVAEALSGLAAANAL